MEMVELGFMIRIEIVILSVVLGVGTYVFSAVVVES